MIRVPAISKVQGILRFLLVCSSIAYSETVGVFYDPAVEQIKFAASDVKSALESKGFTVEMQPLSSLTGAYGQRKVILAGITNTAVTAILTSQAGVIPAALGEQAYALRTTSTPQKSYWVFGGDVNGSMYGGLQIAENIKFYGFNNSYTTEESPHIKKRGIKLNLPMDGRSPTFKNDFASTSHQVAIANVWDMKFWTQWFDEMARYRYNDLSIWTDHPFTSMLKMPDYPEVALQNVQDATGKVIKVMTIDEKVTYWKKVMEYGHNRGFEFYFFVWSFYIHATDVSKLRVDNEGVADAMNANNTTYIRKCMKQFLETYPYIDGFGVTAGEDLNATNAVQWMYDTYGAGMKDYVDAQSNKTRKLAIVIRQFMAANTGDVVAKFKPLTDVGVTLDRSFKYSQGHMYNTLVPDYNNKSGFLEDLVKYNLKTWLTVRNDGVFMHHWGDPVFARGFIKGWPTPEKYLQGFYMGGDGYSHTTVFTSKHSINQNDLEIRRLWYTFMLWGRLSYNPEISDEVFKQTMALKYPSVASNNLFDAWSKVSTVVPLTTELLSKEWFFDFHWWPEICGARGGFRTITEFAEVNPAPGSNRCAIATSANNSCGTKPTSFQTADLIQKNSQDALKHLSGMSAGANTELGISLNNLSAQAYLGLYYADKIRGATFNKAAQKDSAKKVMGRAYCNWMAYTNLMDGMHTGMNMNRVDDLTSWHMHDKLVLAEYTGLGGSGTPSCPTVAISNFSLGKQEKAFVKSISGKHIRFYLPTEENYSLSIFTSSGKKVSDLEVTEGKQGMNEVKFEKSLGQGKYLIRLETESSSLVKHISVISW